MIVYDMVMNVLQHNIAGLISGITFIVLFQSGEASTVEGNKHTHRQQLATIIMGTIRNQSFFPQFTLAASQSRSTCPNLTIKIQ